MLVRHGQGLGLSRGLEISATVARKEKERTVGLTRLCFLLHGKIGRKLPTEKSSGVELHAFMCAGEAMSTL